MDCGDVGEGGHLQQAGSGGEEDSMPGVGLPSPNSFNLVLKPGTVDTVERVNSRFVAS